MGRGTRSLEKTAHSLPTLPTLAPTTSRLTDYDTFDLITLVIFTLELVVKVIAVEGVILVCDRDDEGGWGDWSRRGYLADNWNCLDFCIVLEGWCSFIPGYGIEGVVVIRLVRLLRLLRAARAVPTLRSIVAALFEGVMSA